MFRQKCLNNTLIIIIFFKKATAVKSDSSPIQGSNAILTAGQKYSKIMLKARNAVEGSTFAYRLEKIVY